MSRDPRLNRVPVEASADPTEARKAANFFG
jgi:hypothetical protein